MKLKTDNRPARKGPAQTSEKPDWQAIWGWSFDV